MVHFTSNEKTLFFSLSALVLFSLSWTGWKEIYFLYASIQLWISLYVDLWLDGLITHVHSESVWTEFAFFGRMQQVLKRVSAERQFEEEYQVN